MRIVCVYVNDELEELSAEDNSEVEVCIHSSKEGERECYTCVYVLHPFIEERRVRKVYMCICIVSICRRNRSANVIRMYILYPFIEGRGSEWYTCVYVWYSIVEGRGVRIVYTCLNVCVPYSCIDMLHVYGVVDVNHDCYIKNISRKT